MKDYKVLSVVADNQGPAAAEYQSGRHFKVQPADQKHAMQRLGKAFDNMEDAAETIGHIGLWHCISQVCNLARGETKDKALHFGKQLHSVLKRRGVLKRVLDEIAGELRLLSEEDHGSKRKSS